MLRAGTKRTLPEARATSVFARTEERPMPQAKRQDRRPAAKQASSRWLLLVLFAACSFSVTYGLVTWSRKARDLVQLAVGRIELPSDGPAGMVWIPGGEFTMGTD